jgi:hypothetical protein
MMEVAEHKNIKLFYLTLLKNKYTSIVLSSYIGSFTLDVFNALYKKPKILFRVYYVIYLAIPFEYFIKISFNKGLSLSRPNRLIDLNLFLFSKFMGTKYKSPELSNIIDEFSYMVD